MIKVQVSLSLVVLAARERARTHGYTTHVALPTGETFHNARVWEDGTVLIAASPTTLRLEVIGVRDSKRLLALDEQGRFVYFNGAFADMAPALRALSTPLPNP